MALTDKQQRFVEHFIARALASRILPCVVEVHLVQDTMHDRSEDDAERCKKKQTRIHAEQHSEDPPGVSVGNFQEPEASQDVGRIQYGVIKAVIFKGDESRCPRNDRQRQYAEHIKTVLEHTHQEALEGDHFL